jgi:hypothetical protein
MSKRPGRTDRTRKPPPKPAAATKPTAPLDPREGWEETFLEQLRETGNVCKSYRAAGIRARSWVYERRADPEFARRWDEALADWADGIEAEAYRRAVTGTEKPLSHKGELTGDTVREYSDQVLIVLLRGAKPEKYRETVAHRHGGPDGGPIPVTHDLSALSDEQLDQLAEIHAILAASAVDPGGAGPA